MFQKIVILLTILISSCATNTQKPNEETEKKAIMSIVENENKTFYAKNHAAWSKHYVQNEKVFWACVEPEVTLRASGWNDLSKFVASWMKDNPQPLDYKKANFQNSDIKITLSNDLAFVSMLSTSNEENGQVKKLNNNRTMQKIDGNWKILSMTSYPADSPRNSEKNVYFHGK
jgi:hypothetical protein